MMTPVESFIHRENIKNFERRLADRTTDEDQRRMLARLLAEEKAKAQSQTAKAPQKKTPNRYMRLDAGTHHSLPEGKNRREQPTSSAWTGGTTDEHDVGSSNSTRSHSLSLFLDPHQALTL